MFVSVAGLSSAVHGRRARTGGWLGYLYGAAFFVPLLHWTGVYVGAAPWLLLAAAEAGFMAGLGAVLPLLQRLPLPPLWVGCGWVLQEALRDRLPFGGFPWGRLAFSQASSPLRWFATLGGAPLVSFAVAVGGASLAMAWRAVVSSRTDAPTGAWHRRAGAVLALVASAVGIGALGALLGAVFDPIHHAAGRDTVVALVQGNVPEAGLAFEDRARQVLDDHVAVSDRLAAQIAAGTTPRPGLVVWPENASDVDPFEDPDGYREIDDAVRRVGVPVLVGAILQGPGADHRRNAGILWSPTSGPGSQYIKRHPVPFGEYIPLRSVARWVSSDVNLVTQDMVAGHGNGLVTGGPYPLGDVICFEVAYDNLVRSSVRAGARLLVVQTNNATFGHTDETYQQLAMSRLRAVETGRTVLQVATTGKSAVIGPDGAIRAESGRLFTPDLIVATVPLRTVRTPAVSAGAVPEYVLAGLALLAIGFALHPVRRRLRGRRSAPPPAAPRPTEDPKEMMLR
jgi:apolipoprotein N-acyltransferase